MEIRLQRTCNTCPPCATGIPEGPLLPPVPNWPFDRPYATCRSLILPKLGWSNYTHPEEDLPSPFTREHTLWTSGQTGEVLLDVTWSIDQRLSTLFQTGHIPYGLNPSPYNPTGVNRAPIRGTPIPPTCNASETAYSLSANHPITGEPILVQSNLDTPYTDGLHNADAQVIMDGFNLAAVADAKAIWGTFIKSRPGASPAPGTEIDHSYFANWFDRYPPEPSTNQAATVFWQQPALWTGSNQAYRRKPAYGTPAWLFRCPAPARAWATDHSGLYGQPSVTREIVRCDAVVYHRTNDSTLPFAYAHRFTVPENALDSDYLNMNGADAFPTRPGTYADTIVIPAGWAAQLILPDPGYYRVTYSPIPPTL